MGYNEPIPSAPSASNLSFMNRNISFNNNYQWSQPQAPRVSSMKATLAQCLAALPIFLINFNNMTFYMFISYLGAPELVNLYSTMYIVGLLVGGVTAQIIGGRLMIMLGAIVLVAGWLIFQWVSSMNLLLWTVRVVDLSWGMMQSPSYVYLAEIAQTNARGALMATMILSLKIGSFYTRSVTQIVSLSWSTFRWINLIFPIVGFILMIILPESPHWLANKGRYQRVESSLAWFRGWTTTINVKAESTEIIDHAQKNSSFLKLFHGNSLFISFLIVSYVFAIKAFSGAEYFSVNILLSGSSKDEINFPLILDYGYHLASVGFFVIVAIISQRVLILLSLFSGSLALLSVLIFNTLYNESIISGSTASWLLPTCIILAILLLHFGLGHVPLLLNGELFPSRLRYVGAGVGLCIMEGLERGSFSIYMNCVKSPPFTPNNVFLMLSCINFFGFLTLYFLFPENKNKSIVRIEQSCNSIGSLRRKH